MWEKPLREQADPAARPSGALTSTKRLFHRLLDTLPAGAYLCDPTGRITYFNAHAVRLWGRAPALDSAADRYCGSFRLYATSGAPISHDRCWMARALREEREFNGEEIVIERPDGERRTVLAHASPLFDEANRLVGAVNVLVDISDRKGVERALREADRAKSEFLATMSHEIRTPINAIVGYMDLLDLEIGGPLTEAQRGYLARARAASRHLLSIVAEVLDLARVEAGQMVVTREPHRGSEAVEAAVAVIQPLAASRGITLSGRCVTVPTPVYLGDEDRVRQMLINLLSNGIKFSAPGSEVELSCSVEGGPGTGWVCFRVRDAGIGIAPDQLDRIFEPFVQVEASHTRTRGGAGLGLAISRHLARLMGGDLTVESTVGVGSVFSLCLPAAPAGSAVGRRLADAAARPGTARDPSAFAVAGQALLGQLNEILHVYTERLREEQVGPGARGLSRALLANHAGTLLADIAVTLHALEDGDGTSAGFAAGSEIQRVCAMEHGRQRAYLGWQEADLAREYAALWDEVVRRVRQLPLRSEADVGSVLAAIRSRLEQARAHSVQALRGVLAGAAAPTSAEPA